VSGAARLHLPDVNLLVAAMVAAHALHHRAAAWMDGAERFATCPVTEAGLVRVLMTEAAVGRRVSAAEALAALEAVRSADGWEFLADGASLAAPRVDLAGLYGPKQVTDLHLVNLAASSGAVLATLDAKIPKALTPADQPWVHLV
jgi:toxin-antitoxin system PIN domain toxin